MVERRNAVRARAYLGGQVAFNKHWPTVDCLVRNLSPEGAKLNFSNAVAIPHEVDLTISQRGDTLRARVVWCSGDEAGVAFVPPRGASAPIPLDLARRLRTSEAEKAALQRRVAQLSPAE